tara:strand:+ start:2382 stop:4298 length:1917 start_codon:yes stop_codon:yes gene_type:complete
MYEEREERPYFGLRRPSEKEPTSDEETFFEKYIAGPIESSKRREAKRKGIPYEDPAPTVFERLSEEARARSGLKPGQFRELTLSGTPASPRRRLKSDLAKENEEFLQDVAPGLIKQTAAREASAEATRKARKKGELGSAFKRNPDGSVKRMTEDEIKRAMATTEGALTSEAMQEALDKNKEEATSDKVAEMIRTGKGLTKPSKDKTGKKAAKTGKEAATGLGSQEGAEEQVSELNNILSNQEMSDEEKQAAAKSYMDEFMSVMPKYEGKTGFEKGMDLMKFGMAIAAGNDPNAIANISKGFLMMGDTFTEDAKERRKFNKELGIAAANNVVNRFKEDRERANKLADDLATREHDIAVRELDKQRDISVAEIKAAQKTAESLKRDPTEIGKATKEHLEALNRYQSSLAMKGVLSRIGRLTFDSDGGQPGIKGTLLNWSDKALNAVGMQAEHGPTEEEIQEQIARTEQKTGKAPSRENVITALTRSNFYSKWRSPEKGQREILMSQLSAELAPVILGESGKTISDGDRQRVDKIMGHYYDLITGVTTSERVLKTALEGLEKKIDQSVRKERAALAAVEDNWKGLFTLTGDPVKDQLEKQKRTILGKQTITKGKDVIKFSEMFDLDTGEFTESYKERYGIS